MSRVDDMTITPTQLIEMAQQCLKRWPDAELIKSREGIGNLCVLTGIHRDDEGYITECNYVGALDLRFGEIDIYDDDIDNQP